MATQSSLQNAVRIPDDVLAHIKSNTNTDVQKERLWVICEAEYDMKLYRRFLKGKVTVYPSNIINGKGEIQHDYHTLYNIVSTIKNGGYTERIIGIRDRDYTDYASYKWRKRLPENIFLTDTRDLEMMLYSSNNVKTSLYALHTDMRQKIEDCTPLLRYIAYLRIWHERNNHTVRLNKLSAKCMCEDVHPRTIKTDWKHALITRYNTVVNYPDLMSVVRLNCYSKCHRICSREFTDICRGHDFTELIGKYLDDSNITKDTISETLSYAYSYADFQPTKLAQAITTFVKPWGITVEQNALYE